MKDTDSVPMLLVGNKCDLESACPAVVIVLANGLIAFVSTGQRVVSKSEAEAFAQKLGIPFLETSAFTGQNADEVFTTITREILKRRK